MKTAAQQIGAHKLLSENKPTAYDEALLLSMIEEAERRAEQRVRAEIGRDSERLDWLERQISKNHACEALRTCRCGTASYAIDEWKCTQSGSLRDAIDAARGTNDKAMED